MVGVPFALIIIPCAICAMLQDVQGVIQDFTSMVSVAVHALTIIQIVHNAHRQPVHGAILDTWLILLDLAYHA